MSYATTHPITLKPIELLWAPRRWDRTVDSYELGLTEPRSWVTFEVSDKWYELFVVHDRKETDGVDIVKSYHFGHLEEYAQGARAAYHDHVPNPEAVRLYAAAKGHLIDWLVDEVIEGRWQSNLADNYPECAACGAPCTQAGEDIRTIHRDGLGVGPEVPLCYACGNREEPSTAMLWKWIAGRRKLGLVP